MSDEIGPGTFAGGSLLVVAFEGWNDAGDAASGVIDHLAEITSARLAFAMDPDEYYDYQVNRPSMATTSGGERTLQWPTWRGRKQKFFL